MTHNVSFSSELATLFLYPSDTTTNLSDTVVLSCVAHGFPEPTIIWNRLDGGKFIPVNVTTDTWISNGTIFISSVVTICNIELSDSGEYSCRAENNVTGIAVSDSQNFNLTVQGIFCRNLRCIKLLTKLSFSTIQHLQSYVLHQAVLSLVWKG